MLEIKDIKQLMNEKIIPVLQGINPFYLLSPQTKTPEFYPGYSKAVEYAERVRIHSEIGGFPHNLFKANAPNETPKEQAYIEATYKQTTLPVFLDYHSTMMRMWADNDWYMEYEQDEEKFKEQSLQQYIENSIRVFGSLENYFKSFLMRTREADANGLIAVKPYKIVQQTEDGEQPISETELYEPQVYYYRVDQVVAKSYDEYYLVMLDEKSPVKIGGRTEYKGYVFELYDEENIYKVTQTGKAEDFKFSYQLYFNHGEGVVPAKELGGDPQIINGNIIWQPKFLSACDLLDISLVLNQYLRACHANVCFPYRIMLGNRCTFEYTDTAGMMNTCNKGYVYDSVKGGNIQCPSCKGFSLVDRVSRTGQMLIEPDGSLSKGDDPKMVANAIQYVGPDVEPLRLTKELEDDAKEQARAVLHLKTSSTKVQPNAEGSSALGDVLDSKAMKALILSESHQVFTLKEWAVDRIGWQRYADDYKKPYFKYPTNCDTTSDSDYLRRISEMQTANVPTALIEAEIDKYIQSLYSSEKDSQDKYKLIAKTDRLFFLSQEDINIKLSRGTVDKWESVLHDSSGQLVDMLIQERMEDKNSTANNTCVYPYVCTPVTGFYSNDFKMQQELLIAKAKEVAGAINAIGSSNNLIEEIANGGSKENATTADNLGKLPLAAQQLTLASTRAREGGNVKLAKALDVKTGELVNLIDPESIAP